MFLTFIYKILFFIQKYLNKNNEVFFISMIKIKIHYILKHI